MLLLPFGYYIKFLRLVVGESILKRVIICCVLGFCINLAFLMAVPGPLWLAQRPYSSEFFFGRGKGTTEEAAILSAKNELLLQIASQVEGVIRHSSLSTQDIQKAVEATDAYINATGLRSATVEATVKQGQFHYALLRYPEKSGLLIAASSIMRFKNHHGIDPLPLIEQWKDGTMIKAARMDRVLHDLANGEYGPDIKVMIRGSSLVVQVLNFEAYDIRLTEGQRQGLELLGQSLLPELQYMNHGEISVMGYANPTHIRGEQNALMRFSQGRAETMAETLRETGLVVNSAKGLGGIRLLGDTKSAQGKGLNRRVEINMEILK